MGLAFYAYSPLWRLVGGATCK